MCSSGVGAVASKGPVSTSSSASIIKHNAWYRSGTVCGPVGPLWNIGSVICLARAIRCNENIQYVKKITCGVKNKIKYVTWVSTMASMSSPRVYPKRRTYWIDFESLDEIFVDTNSYIHLQCPIGILPACFFSLATVRGTATSPRNSHSMCMIPCIYLYYTLF